MKLSYIYIGHESPIDHTPGLSLLFPIQLKMIRNWNFLCHVYTKLHLRLFVWYCLFSQEQVN